jgi:hypothetical protein
MSGAHESLQRVSPQAFRFADRTRETNLKNILATLFLGLAASAAANADEIYGRYLLCDTTVQGVRGERFFAAAMKEVKLKFSVAVGGRRISGEGYANDRYGIFQLSDGASGETRTWSGELVSAHGVERQAFRLALGELTIDCQYGIPIGP